MENIITQAPSLSTTRQRPRLRDLSTVHQWLKILLWSGVGLLALSIVSGWVELQLLGRARDGYDISETAAVASDDWQGLLGWAELFLWVVTAIIFLTFKYRACQNARTLATSRMDFTPGWSVGWYFVPIANWIRPYQAMRQIYRVSENPNADLKQRGSTPIVSGWWALWIISTLLEWHVFRTSASAAFDGATAELYHASLMALVADVIDIPLYLIAIALVGRIFEMQMSRSRGSVN